MVASFCRTKARRSFGDGSISSGVMSWHEVPAGVVSVTQRPSVVRAMANVKIDSAKMGHINVLDGARSFAAQRPVVDGQSMCHGPARMSG